jgi:class 3 adenylate cyclase
VKNAADSSSSAAERVGLPFLPDESFAGRAVNRSRRPCPAYGSLRPGPTPPKHLAEKILTSRTALEGERKQVTVLFADLKGSMELLADRDLEEARKLLDPVLEHMMEAVHRFEGTVNQVMGDGIMALFGAPVAHEDHAVRACYAALDMQATMRRYSEDVRRSHGIEVQIRVGLDSGEVIIRTIGSDLHMDYTAVGQTTHLAARMEQLALPGAIRLTADTLRLTEGYVEVTPLGPVPVKGLGGARRTAAGRPQISAHCCDPLRQAIQPRLTREPATSHDSDRTSRYPSTFHMPGGRARRSRCRRSGFGSSTRLARRSRRRRSQMTWT